jgi:hypothetical protein
VNQLEMELAFAQALNLEAGQVLHALILALVLGLVISTVYRFSIAERLVSPALQMALVLLCMTASMVMMVIGNNLARAFSLVGALAIVRFRTRLRSPFDISFVFLSLAVGISCGVFADRVAILGTLVISLTVVAMHVLPISRFRGEVHLLRIDISAYQIGEKDIAPILDKHLLRRWMEEARSLRFGETISFRYRVMLKRDGSLEQLLRDLSALEGTERVLLMHGEDGSGQID